MRFLLGLFRTNSINNIRLPWFRVHIVILNDPGRLISVHIDAIIPDYSRKDAIIPDYSRK